MTIKETYKHYQRMHAAKIEALISERNALDDLTNEVFKQEMTDCLKIDFTRLRRRMEMEG